MKILERIIERRLRQETSIGDEQVGFMPGMETTDAIFAVRQLMEKHRWKTKRTAYGIYRRPKRRWLDNIKNDLSGRELSGEEAQDQVQWRRLIINIDTT